MNVAAQELSEAKSLLSKGIFQEKWNLTELAKFLEQFANLFLRTSQDQRRSMVAQFHSCAGRFPYVNDSDYGALVLEVVADSAEKSELRTWLYTEARIRAALCASGATGSGEGMARM